MSSNLIHEYLEIADLDMLERVLERAGYYGPTSEVETSETKEAALFLMRLFQSGIDSESDLVAALDARGKSAGDGGDTPAQVRVGADDRWIDEGGQGVAGGTD
ncbi:hypothetical protein RHAB21_02551 [Pseudorhizobium halotolerans]|uniref:Uncharacterized protein n=1 Tax=Pseudorhizobium halotolerans TaxID=1233081 RepID=A0ABN7JLG5_9HYPH|nr:hypothetical protein [Pseudorhizobium halotolerans]CAD7036643.1 hypothetical protein RHAB21_02551 [Pseudorhizobium halotolerans]